MGLDFLAFWLFGGQLLRFPPRKFPKMAPFPISHTKNLAAPGPGLFSNIWPFWCSFSILFGLVGIHFLSFWLCAPSFPFILALWALISLQFGHLGLDFLSFWPCGPSFPCILALWALISFHFGLVGLDFVAFWLFGGQLLGPPQVAKNGPFSHSPIQRL